MNVNRERVVVGWSALFFCFVVIILDGLGVMNVSKFGYAAIGGWVSLIINFYYRKNKVE